MQSKQTPKHKLGNPTNRSVRTSKVREDARCPSSKSSKQQRQQRQRQHRLKKRLNIQPMNRARIEFIQFVCSVRKSQTEYVRQRKIRNINFKNYPSWFMFSTQRRIWSFHALVLQRTVKKCTKNYNTRAKPLYCSRNLLVTS